MILSDSEMREILEAAQDTLCYALTRTTSITVEDDPANAVEQSLDQALRCVESAAASRGSMVSVKGYGANALAKLRTALMALQEMNCADEGIRLTLRATARAISLIYPFTQTEGPLRIVPRKSPESRRRRQVYHRRPARPHPLFNLVLDRDCRFFTGFVGDIASGGLFIETYNIYPVGTKLTVMAELAADRVIMGSVRVVWIREHAPGAPEIHPGMGVIFQNLTRTAENEINEYLLGHDSIFYEVV